MTILNIFYYLLWASSMRKRLLEGSHAYISGLKIFRKYSWFLSILPPLGVLWHRAARSRRPFPWRCTEEKGERYIWTLAVVKPARGTAIRFLGSATARLLEVDRLHSALLQSALHRLFTRTECWSVSVIEFNMSMFRFVLLCQFLILFEIATALLLLFCLKLKFGLFKHIFPTKSC